MIRALPLLAVLCGPALAEPWACAFTAECIAGESCDESTYALEVLAADHEGQLFLSSVSGDLLAARQTARDALPATYIAERQLLTITADSTAILTAHIPGDTPLAITYFGTCEGL